jgi:hypothetical protein
MTASSGGRSTQKTWPLTGKLLLCGAIAGPLFLLTVLIQDYTRPGFDPRLVELSLLSLGDWGWVQIVNFVLAGMLNLLYAAGLWRRLHPGRAGTWGPLLIGGYGFGLMVAGVFRDDPANGFPPGVPAATTLSPGTPLFMISPASSSSLCWQRPWGSLSGSFSSGRSVGGLSIACQALSFSSRAFSSGAHSSCGSQR